MAAPSRFLHNISERRLRVVLHPSWPVTNKTSSDAFDTIPSTTSRVSRNGTISGTRKSFPTANIGDAFERTNPTDLVQRQHQNQCARAPQKNGQLICSMDSCCVKRQTVWSLTWLCLSPMPTMYPTMLLDATLRVYAKRFSNLGGLSKVDPQQNRRFLPLGRFQKVFEEKVAEHWRKIRCTLQTWIVCATGNGADTGPLGTTATIRFVLCCEQRLRIDTTSADVLDLSWFRRKRSLRALPVSEIRFDHYIRYEFV